MSDAALTLSNISMRFPFGTNWRGKPCGFVHALNKIDLTIVKGKTLGIVGESGCGKSTLAEILMGILTPSEGEIERNFDNEKGIQIVFQDPQSSLNARMPVWRVIIEPIFATQKISRDELRAIAVDLAQQVGLRKEVLERFPHEFLGGQRQRIAIARALSSNPDVIILDEPTSALDISIQAQILNRLKELQHERGLTYIFISHDISVVRYLCDEMVVMYLGQVVEHGPIKDVLDPYTALLLESIPQMNVDVEMGEPMSITELPSNRNLPSGCFFYDRCDQHVAACQLLQKLMPVSGRNEHSARCT